MLTRRAFARRAGTASAAIPLLSEFALAQRARVPGGWKGEMVWLNANENPAGPPAASIEAMTRVLPTTGRYHYQEFEEFYATIARSEDLAPDHVVIGAGSSEVLHDAVDAFTSPTRPLIAMQPVYEGPVDLSRALGHPVIGIRGTATHAADVKQMAAEAAKAGGGLLYICNPNNPTSAITPKGDIAWLVNNLPPNTVALIDEAYMNFADSPDVESAVTWVRQKKDVIVTRTFSKIWGMAALRCGYGLAKPELTKKMLPYVNNVISYVTVQAIHAALPQAQTILPERRARLLKTRRELCAWLDERGLSYIQPHANFVMIDVKRDARTIIPEMPKRGVAVGRPFPPFTNMMRVSIGTDADMAKFREVFWSVYKG